MGLLKRCGAFFLPHFLDLRLMNMDFSCPLSGKLNLLLHSGRRGFLKWRVSFFSLYEKLGETRIRKGSSLSGITAQLD